MLDILSEDVIWRVFKYLDIKSRVILAVTNKAFYRLFNKWEDVLYCSIRLDGITLAGEDFILELERTHLRATILALLRRCPLIRKLAIHDEQALYNTADITLRMLVNVDELHIPCNIFSKSLYDQLITSLFSFPKLHTLHIQQRYSDDKCNSNILHKHQVEKLVSTVVNNIKLQGVVVTGSALTFLCWKYRKTLETLCLQGALLPSYDAPECFRAINSLNRLTYLTVAPSLYSISSINKTFYTSYPNLKDLKMLKVIAVYVSRPDISQLKILLNHILPPTVQQLLLYDESYRLCYQTEEDLKRSNCKITFCRDDDIIIDSYWMNGKSELLTHTLWKPPYKRNIYLPNTYPEWYCILSELMETAVLSEYSCISSMETSTAPDNSENNENTCIDQSYRARQLEQMLAVELNVLCRIA
ncbi:unnamed protein product [Thelazia callipaeda]|uniref:F-box domain-containing protein n=1 Tax=Thelazia callipaeda TaxID=103827 RepID=A0A0N5D8A2_THECL|nr:unnamed protein product [Thelazia callipaeda]